MQTSDFQTVALIGKYDDPDVRQSVAHLVDMLNAAGVKTRRHHFRVL